MLQLEPWPGFVAERLRWYQELKRESDALLAARAAENRSIRVELPDGGRVEARAWITTPYQLARDLRWVVLRSPGAPGGGGRRPSWCPS